MKTQPWRITYWTVAIIFCATAVLAQTNLPPPLPNPLQTSQSDLWKFGVAAITPILIAFVKWGLPKVPKMLLPCLAPFVGLLLGFAFNAVGLTHLSWVDSVQLGALGVFFRELVDQGTKLNLQKLPGTAN